MTIRPRAFAGADNDFAIWAIFSELSGKFDSMVG